MRIVMSSLDVAILTLAPAARAGGDEAVPKEVDSDRVHAAIGVHGGAVVATPRIGTGLDFSLDVSARKSVKNVILSAGLRPHYERYAYGDSDLVPCTSTDACGNSVIVKSHTNANVFQLEVPLIAEFALKFTSFHPFVGLSPSFGNARFTEDRQAQLPVGNSRAESVSHNFFALSAFGGGVISMADHSALVFRVGYRFAPTFDDIPGGSASLRGVIASLGYRFTF